MKVRLPVFIISLLLFITLIGNCELYSQNSKVDSIEFLLDKSEGVNKINYYYILTDYFVYNAPNKAIRLANEFLILGEKYDSTGVIEHCYQILGEAYFLQEKYDLSLDYFKKYLSFQVEIKNEHELGHAYNNLGIVYRALNDYPQAIACYEKALEKYKELNNIGGISSTYNNLGVLHEHLNLFSQAKEFYEKSLEIGLEIKDQEGISTSYLNLGGINLKLRKYNTAIDFCNKSIAISDSFGYNHTIEINYDILYKVYKEKNDKSNALLYLEKFYEYRDERINEENNAQISELEIKYQSDKKQQEIELLNKQTKQRGILNYIVLAGLVVFSLLILFLIKTNKLRRTNNQNLRLRNAEALQQNEEIEAQRDEIEAQRDEIKRQIELSEMQTNKILKQNKDITDSIEYAKHIQIALFPEKINLQRVLKNGFCLFKPKDIVSGDFYWVAQIGKKSIIVAADCTGHGVPGAFMSIIGINFLNEIIFDELILQPSEILSYLRRKIIKTMVHADRIDESKDGMDISLIVVDYDKMVLEYAGAYNNLYFIRDHMLEVVKADRMPVGISEKAIAPFTNHTLNIKPGDNFYMFTDGFADQFGGPSKKKFRVGNLRELLLEIHEKEMPEQKRILHETFINWKGKQPQVDDILSMGIRI
jgi:serine phosphatase RsbU (regulator of sigma subunit)/TPR repeat protein